MYHSGVSRNRGNTRGGQGDFTWDQVKSDKDRENYLGHSIMAPVGRWQKNKDLQWFSKDKAVSGADELKRRQELLLVKQQEREALAAMLRGDPVPNRVQTELSKEEMTELLKKGQTDEENPLAADHIKGVGFGLTGKGTAYVEMTAGLSAQDKLEGSALTLTLEQRSEMGQDRAHGPVKKSKKEKKEKKDKKKKHKKEKSKKHKDRKERSGSDSESEKRQSDDEPVKSDSESKGVQRKMGADEKKDETTSHRHHETDEHIQRRSSERDSKRSGRERDASRERHERSRGSERDRSRERRSGRDEHDRGHDGDRDRQGRGRRRDGSRDRHADRRDASSRYDQRERRRSRSRSPRR